MTDPFYLRGLRFSCSKCAGCCGGGPGYVFLCREDLRRLLAHFRLDFPDFFKKYCTVVDTGFGLSLSLAEKTNYDCVFLSGGACEIYNLRPLQCATYPFWAAILESEATWQAEAANCPGVERGELHGREHIEERLYERRAAKPILLEYGTDPERLSADTLLGC